MTAGAPWSVKGIDPKAREVAKDLARRSGMTLGEWLNRMILEDDPEDAVSKALFGDRPARPQGLSIDAAPPAAGRLETQAGSNEDIARVALALDRLTDHIEASETRTGLAISGVEQSVRAALVRLETTERRVEGAVQEIRAGHAEVVDRVRRVEQEAAGPRSAEALRALEAALSKVAGKLDQKDDRTKDLLSAVEARIQRLEGGDTASATVVEDSFGKLSERLADAEGRTSDAVESLRQSFAALDGRLRAVESGGAVDQRLEELAATLGKRLEEARGEIAAQLAASAEDRFDRMERKLGEMAEHVQAAEQRSAQAIQKMSEDLAGVAGSLTQRVQAAESGAAAVSAELAKIGDSQAEALTKLSDEITRISERLTERIANAERRSAQAIDDVGEKLSKVSDRLGDRTDKVSSELSERIRASEERTARLLDEAREKIDQRLAEAQKRQAEQAMAAPPAPSVPEPPLPPAETLDEAPEPFAPAAVPEPFAAARALFGSAFPAARTERPAPEPGFDEADFEAADGFAPAHRAGPEDLEQPEVVDDEPAPPADPLAEVFSALDAEPPEAAKEPLPDGDAELLKPPALEPAPGFDVEPATAAAGSDPQDAGPMWPRPEPRRLDDGFDDDAGPPEPGRSSAQSEGQVDADDAEADDLFEPKAQPEKPLERLTARELIEQARAAARASAAGQKPAKAKDKSEEGGKLFSGFSVAKKRRAGGTLPTAVLVAGGMAAAGLSISGLVLQSGEIQKGAEAEIAAQDATASAEAGPKAPLAAVALQPKKLTEAAPSASPDVDLEALYAEAAQALDAGDASGLKKLEQAANLGHAPAQFYLAKLYEAGRSGVKQDLAEARRWTERAAQRGERKAMHNLALYYFEGTGGPKNTTAAAEWFRRAAEMGLLDSQYNLGRLHEEGIGVPQNGAEAYRWYLIAGRAGDAESRASAQRVKAQLSAEARVVAEKSAAAFRAAAPSLGADADKANVAMAQKALSRLNYYQVLGPADGVPSPALRMAVAAYQRDQGLPATGELDSLTVSRLAVYAR